ncbi:MAG: hypothetical protein EXX96DRAFT_525128 [Benjaminiella poitrasii]|nr:MAG: hypothetical protein EXX96DRAFT_525128 [Benjaminiella poitrasii]
MSTHSFSNCPLRSSSLLITHHKTQSIITATDEVLDLLGYSLSDLLGNSIHSLSLKLSSEITCIPECTIKHADGHRLNFQVCIHQDPLVDRRTANTSCLDYWLIRLLTTKEDKPCLPALFTILRLSPYGTIEQIQHQQQQQQQQIASFLKQPMHELIGRPVMAFVYDEDVPNLCSRLARLCSSSATVFDNSSPLFIRWLNLPFVQHSHAYFDDDEEEDSLCYNWMSFTLLMANQQQHQQPQTHPICLLRPLHIPYEVLKQPEQEEDQGQDILSLTLLSMMLQHVSLLSQLIGCCRHFIQSLKISAKQSKVYVNEFYNHVVYQLMELISSALVLKSSKCTNTNTTTRNIQVVNNGTQRVVYQVPLMKQEEQITNNNSSSSGGSSNRVRNFLWDLTKSNMQRSLNILEFTGLLNYYQTTHLKTCIETLNT